ncbi:UDP-glucuronosyltransferase 1A1 isoform X3 [Amia ocellicauda]|uniref:UDP-glucuronosyltransferase 1A1 isoform X3 n=1 Tax=Amia ocellicauda TaxID=2972642 RepID=UPI00346468E5
MARKLWFPVAGLLAWLCLSVLGPTDGGKLLIMPVEGSHWLSLKVLVNELAQRGHEVVVLVPETNILIKGSDAYKTETFSVPFSKEQLEQNIAGLIQGLFGKGPPKDNGIMANLRRLINFTNMQVKGCESLLYNEGLMQHLKEEKFDLMLTDPFLPCGSIIARAFSLPTVYFLRGIPCGLNYEAAQCPMPPSYVPRFFTGSTDRMTFPQRVQNYLMMLAQFYLCRTLFTSFDELSSRYLQKDITYKELLGHGSIWLLRYDFTFEYPKPQMPNMVLIGGINCVKKNVLTQEVEKFVNSSGEHGFVVFTMGSMVSEMPLEKATQFVDAFRRIPQKVLWRYTGPTPDNLPDNLKLMKWLPQNDLLGHPKVKAFITHGGTHGIYEGICNGVPMVMLPLFGDQPDNVHRMVTRKVGVSLNIQEMTSNTLLEAVNTVIHDKSYKENMMKLSAVHKDRPVEPLDLAVFWTEFVMRHKGAEHLRPAAHDLNWIQYHSLDVIGLLVAVVIISSAMMVKCCTFCFKKCCRSSTSLKKKAD